MLSQFELSVVGKYFNTVDDFKNITRTTKRYKQLNALYHMNPVPLNTLDELELFPSIQTYRATSDSDLRMIMGVINRPEERTTKLYRVIMDYTADIDRKQELKQFMDEKDVILVGNYASPIRIDMDEEVTRLSYGGLDLEVVDLSKTKVEEIPNSMFYKKRLTEIRLPNTVTSLGVISFYSCAWLQNVILSNSLKKIRYGAFGDCVRLENIVLPNSLTFLGANAFEKCTNLSSIHLSSNLRVLSSYAFCECVKLQNISVPSTVTSLGDYVFKDCHALSSINFNPNVKALPQGLFYDCVNLREITLPTTVTSLESKCFHWCGLRRVKNLERVREVRGDTFEDCKSLEAPYVEILKQIPVI